MSYIMTSRFPMPAKVQEYWIPVPAFAGTGSENRE
jgi:hypothetical protein